MKNDNKFYEVLEKWLAFQDKMREAGLPVSHLISIISKFSLRNAVAASIEELVSRLTEDDINFLKECDEKLSGELKDIIHECEGVLSLPTEERYRQLLETIKRKE